MIVEFHFLLMSKKTPEYKKRTPHDLEVAVVLVCLGCYNKILQIGWLVKSRDQFLRVLETGSLRSGVR